MKDYKGIILNSVTTKEILDINGIKIKRDMFCCPFHGDKTPSAKAYKNTFYCFSCGKGGDLIQFVQYYNGLNFLDAMQKINIDFNLGFDFKNDFDETEYKKVKEEIIRKKAKKEKEKREFNEKMINICKNISILNQLEREFKDKITPYNWEEKEEQICKLNMAKLFLEEEFEDNLNKVYDYI